jgi:hypothetical protein
MSFCPGESPGLIKKKVVMKKSLILLSFVLTFISALAGIRPEEFNDRRISEDQREDHGQSIQYSSLQVSPHINTTLEINAIQQDLSRSKLANAWNLYAGNSGVPRGPVKVVIPTGTLASIKVDQSIMVGADYAEGLWYVVSNTSNLHIANPATGTYQLIGNIGLPITGLAYDPVSGIMYASGLSQNNSLLYRINLETAAPTYVGQIGPGEILGIAADAHGQLYGITLGDSKLFSINSSTGASTLIGSLGLDLAYAQDIAFDRDDNKLYGTLFLGPATVGAFYEININTGQAILKQTIGAEVAAFAIPYTVALDNAPGAITSFNVLAGAQGALNATLNWVNPSITANSQPLTSLTSIVIQRNGVIIHTINNPGVGAAGSFTDNSITQSGIYTYRVYAVNSVGDGLKTSKNSFVGIDVPAAPGNVNLVANGGNSGILSWEAPTTGLNNGYISGQNVKFKVVRMPDNITVAQNLTETGFIDNSIQQIGNYFYIVTASDNTGTGGSAASNTVLLGGNGVLLYEPFNYPAGQLPAGWQKTGAAHVWGVNNASSAGGHAPEFRLYFHPPATGESLVRTSAINVEGQNKLRLKYKQRLRNHFINEGEKLSINASYDAGQTWQVLWQMVVNTDIYPGENELIFDVPPGKTTLHLGFKLVGNSYNITSWTIDDLVLEPVLNNDLVAVSVTGEITPFEGNTNLYNIAVKNAGLNPQNNYTVKLMQEDTVIGSVAGNPINFGQTIVYNIPWIPQADKAVACSLYGAVVFEADEMQDNNKSAPLKVYIQDPNTVIAPIGDGDVISSAQPFDFGIWPYSLNQTIYYPEEIGMGGGAISGIEYYNSFMYNYPDRDIMIWMGETTQGSLAGGWINPQSLQLVFNGSVDFPAGENRIHINLDTPYIYSGGNLVVYSYKIGKQTIPGQVFYNTEDPGRIRSRHAGRQTPYDPLIPVSGSHSNTYFPNISMFVSSSGLGGVQGTSHEGGTPLADVTVKVTGTNFTTTTDQNGFYQFPYLTPGTYNLQFTKFGYKDLLVENVIVVADETNIINTSMVAISTLTLSGFVAGSDYPDIGLEGAIVKLSGYGDYQTVTAADGSFSINQVYASKQYNIHVYFEVFSGYQAYNAQIQTELTDLVLDDIILSETILPVSDVVAKQTENGVKITWGQPYPITEFRYDNGVVSSQLGWQNDATWNSVMGAAHKKKARLYEMTWMLTDMGGSHPTVKVWVVGLRPDGTPDKNNILYSQANVPNINNTWSTHKFPAPIDAPNGFFIGVSFAGFLGLALDNGSGFTPSTQFGIFDISSPNSNFVAIETWGFPSSFLIRAKGMDFGPLGKSQEADNMGLTLGPIPSAGFTDFYFDAGEPTYSNHYNSENKAVEAFNIYRFKIENEGNQQAWTKIADNFSQWEFLDTQWYNQSVGTYKFAVKAVYTHNIISPPALSNSLVLTQSNSVDYTVKVTTSNGGSPSGAEIILTRLSNKATYSMTAPENGIVFFPSVVKGAYNINITLEGYEDYFANDVLIDANGLWHDAELIWDESQQVSANNMLQLYIFPNPVNHTLFIESPAEILNIRIFNLLGQQVYSNSPGDFKHEIGVSGFNPGMYLIQLTTPRGIFSQRIQVGR